MSFISDTLFVYRRQQRLILRVPAFLIVGVLQPILYLALFGPLLTRLPAGTLAGGSGTGGTAEAYRFFVPGLLIQLALFGSTFVGFAIISEWRAGVIERYRVTPISRVALLTGRVMRDVVTLIVQSTVLILAGLAFGLRAPLGAVLLSYVYLVLVAIGLSSLSYAVALQLKSEDAFAPLVNSVVVPLILLSGGSGSGGTAEAYQFFVPGLLIQLALFGSTFVGFAIISDWRSGVIERYRVTPVSRVSILAGRVLRDVTMLIIQSIVLIVAGLAFGLRAPLPAVLMGFVYIVLVAIGLASVSYAVALMLKSEDAFAPLINSIIVPLVLLSGIMLPLTLGPGWLQGIARISPFRYIIDAMREAYAGRYWDAITVEGLCVAVGTAAVLLWLGSRVFVTENA